MKAKQFKYFLNSSIYKRGFALLLALIFISGIFPNINLQANPQAPVNTFEMQAGPSPERNYTLNFTWTRPPAVTGTTAPTGLTPPHWIYVGPPGTPATDAARQASWNSHRATRYEIRRLPAVTAARPWLADTTFVHNIASTAENPSVTIANNSLPVAQRMQDGGRFYVFRVDAFHSHLPSYFQYHPSGPITPEGFPQFANPAAEQGAIGTQHIYFMTDILVEAEGTVSELTLRWTPAQLDNSDPFNQYAIWLAPGGSGVPGNQIFAAQPIMVPAIGPMEDGMRVHTIQGNFLPGINYAVAVEPVLGGFHRRNHPNFEGFLSSPQGLGREVRLTTNHYRTNNAFIRPNFIATPIGLDRLLLSWDSLFAADAEWIELHMHTYPFAGQPTFIGRLNRLAGEFVNYWLLNPRPTALTEFTLIIRDANDNIIDQITTTFDPTITRYTPTRPDILHIEHIPQPAVAPIYLNVTWEAFHRMPYSAQEMAQAQGGFYFDRNIIYEVAIADTFEALDTLPPMFFLEPDELVDPVYMAEFGTWTIMNGFDEFYHTASSEIRPIEANRVYHIRIVTRRTTPNAEMSAPAYAAHFIPPANVPVRPPVIPSPPLLVVEEGYTDMTIEWPTHWFETFDSQIGEWVYEPSLSHLPPDWAVANAAFGGSQPLRLQSLLGMNYQIWVRPYSDIAGYIYPTEDFEEFIQNIPANQWVNIIPTAVDAPVTRLRHQITNLNENTTYAILFRPVSPLASASAWWPTFLTGTTLGERTPIVVTPTVPFLIPYQAGGTWLRFGLRPFSSELNYEFRIGELPQFASSWEISPIDEQTSFTSSGQSYRRFATNPSYPLFPETMYYIWVRSVNVAGTASQWSNPIAMSTLPIVQPEPPRGLGLASQVNLNVINVENSLQLTPVSPNSIIVQWLPNSGDINLTGALVNSIITGASNSQILGSPNINHSYLLQFNELNANRAHYVRARTIFSVHRTAPGNAAITQRYNYIIQISENPNFTDAITVYVLPDAYTITNNVNTRMAMSAWTQTFIFHTGMTDGEFDGDNVPELFPLPDHDFERIYNAQTQTLTYRFRSTGVDADGNRDNLVDQRFISRLIANRVFDFILDMTHYNNNPVANRVVELPFSIISAFDDRNISFTVVAGYSTYSFAAGFADTPQVNTAGFTVDSRLRLYITNLSLDTPLTTGQNYATPPQNVGINIVNPTNQLRMEGLAAPLSVSHTINRSDALDRNIGSFTRTPNDIGWQRANDSFDQAAGMLRSSVTRLSDFAAIEATAPTMTQLSIPVRDALYSINATIRLDNMHPFAPSDYANAWYVNRLISAVAQNARYVDMYANLTNQETTSLTNAGMLVPGAATVTRELAISAMVRLYEVRTRSRITAHGSLATSSFPDIATASPHLQDALLKAEFLGFLDHNTGLANPLGNLTMADFLLMMELVLLN